jgi:hypothetical protein
MTLVTWRGPLYSDARGPVRLPSEAGSATLAARRPYPAATRTGETLP